MFERIAMSSMHATEIGKAIENALSSTYYPKQGAKEPAYVKALTNGLPKAFNDHFSYYTV